MEQTFILKGLDCANCAEKIATRLQKLEAIDDVEYSFMTGKYTLYTNTEITLEELENVVHKLEPDVEVLLNQKNSEEIKHSDINCNCVDNSDEHEHTIEATHDHTHEITAKNPVIKNFFTYIKGHMVARIIITLITLVGLHFLPLIQPLEFIAYLFVYLLIGIEVVYTAFRNILKGEWFDENFLMTVATIGALGISDYPEAVVVMLFYQIGEYFQERAVENSRKSIVELMDIRPDYANLKIDGAVSKVAPESVKIGDTIIVKPGEKIPLDGVVTEGESYLDTAALTGESVPRKVEPNDPVLSGVINKNGVLTIEVTKSFGESTVSKILDLVENASTKKAPTEKFITKFSHYYTPVVVFAALALAFIPPIFMGFDTFFIWLERALTFLVISCPCALVISVPLGFFGGIGLASKNGILIKGGNFLEALGSLDTVVFDKTGTLTEGKFAIIAIETDNGFTVDEVLEYATYGEWFSSHPIALAIKEKAIPIDETKIANYEEVAGHGIKLDVDDINVLVGNHKLMITNNIQYTQSKTHGTLVYVAINGKFAGTIVIADKIKDDAKETITGLAKHNINTVMLTGDNYVTAKTVATDLGMTKYYAELLPQQKVEKVDEILANKKGNIMFVGDGINDAPVLAQADLGVSMGAIGSDAAIEASDIVLMSDEPSKILTAINISMKTNKVVWQNIVFALIVKAIVLILGALGFATMWAAVFADVGVSFIAILNSVRITRMDV